MKANELRLGNLVYYTVTGRNKLIGEITGLNKTVDGLKAVIDYHYPSSFGEPIPLTPSVLDAIDWGGYTDLSINSYFKIDNVGHLYYCGDYTGVNLYHLHQLQNLYFALTGTELEIDINKLK